MKYAAEMVSGAVICIRTKFTPTKVDRGNTHTHREHGNRISLLSFFLNKKSKILSL
jgi:hypothetical protein